MTVNIYTSKCILMTEL